VLELPAVWEGRTVCGGCFDVLSAATAPPPRPRWWRRRGTLAAGAALVAASALAIALWPASYRRRTEPLLHALVRVQADLDATAPDAAYRADLGAADAVAVRWSGSLSPAERRKQSCRSLKAALAAYDALLRHRAEVTRGERAKDWELVDDAQRSIDNTLTWAPRNLAEARQALAAGD